jgi:hypothetical protein
MKLHVRPVEAGTDSESTRVIAAFGWTEAIITDVISGSAYFTNRAGTANYGTHIYADQVPEGESTSEWRYIRVSNCECEVAIMSKYDISGITCYDASADPTYGIFRRQFDGDSLEYLFNGIQSFHPGTGLGICSTNYKFLRKINPNVLNSIQSFQLVSDNNKLDASGTKGKFDDFMDTDIVVDDDFAGMHNLVKLILKKIHNRRTYQNKTTRPTVYLSKIAQNHPLLVELSLDQIYINPTDSIVSLGSLINLTTMEILPLVSDSNWIGGTIEGFVAAQRAAGRTTCEGIRIPFLGYTNVTFNGHTLQRNIQSPDQDTISWNNSTITVTIAGTSETAPIQ